jgi:hypothetical protein
MRPPSVSTVRLVVFATVALTLFHFTDNAVSVETYPAAGWQPDWFEWLVVAAWLLYTAIGVTGYRLYSQGRTGQANLFLVVYAFTVISSLGHFLYGSPDELTTRGLVSVFVDVGAGSVVLAVALWSILAHRAEPASQG